MRFHIALADRVFLAAGRNHSSDVAGSSPARQVPPLHHGPSHAVDLRHCRSSQYSFQVISKVKNTN